MKLLFHPRFLPALLLLSAPIAFVSGCGGGGGGGPVAPTRTPTASPTPSPTPASAFIGTYTGTYNFPASGGFSAASGPLILGVKPDGTATGEFNGGDGNFESGFSASGTVSLSTGQLSLSGTTTDKSQPPVTATVKVTGTASSSGAFGPLAYSDSGGITRSGSFATTKTSSSPPAPATPQPTAVSGGLKKANSFLLQLRARK